MANGLINHIYVMLLLVTQSCLTLDYSMSGFSVLHHIPKTQKDGVWGASGLVNMWRFRKSGTSREHGSSEPFSHTLPCGITFIRLFLNCIPFNKPMI